MAISLNTFTTLGAQFKTAVQSSWGQAIDYTSGSIFKALGDSFSLQILGLQVQALAIYAVTRLATSTGSDVDSWVADFGLAREGATASTTTLVVTSASPGEGSSTIATGDVVGATQSGITYAAVNGPYVRPQGTASISVAVVCTTPGTTGNVPAGAINLLGSAIANLDTVTNPNAVTNATDAETDAQLRARFVLYINSRSLGTLAAYEAAIEGVSSNLFYQIVENQDGQGNTTVGLVTIFVDDGSGNPPQALLTQVYSAVDGVRADAVAIAVVGPHVVEASVVMSLATDSTVTHSTVTAAVQAAISAYIDQLEIGAVLSYTRLINLAYATSSGITNVTGVTLNGAQADLGGGAGQAVRAQSVVVN